MVKILYLLVMMSEGQAYIIDHGLSADDCYNESRDLVTSPGLPDKVAFECQPEGRKS